MSGATEEQVIEIDVDRFWAELLNKRRDILVRRLGQAMGAAMTDVPEGSGAEDRASMLKAIDAALKENP